MIIFGSRIYGKKNVVSGWSRCEQCGTYGPQSSYDGRKWGHIYYIPLIPSGPHLRITNECTKCKQGIHIPKDDIPEIVLGMRESTNAALTALAAGNTEFTPDGSTESLSCLGTLYGSIEFLLFLDEEELVDSMLRSLEDSRRTYERQMLMGKTQEFKGQPEEAANAYESAAQLENESSVSLVLAGEMWFLTGNLERALEAFRRASTIDPQDLDSIQGMIDVYTAQGDHWNITEMYERAFNIVPDLRNEKKVMKAYKKSCKAANRQPMPA